MPAGARRKHDDRARLHVLDESQSFVEVDGFAVEYDLAPGQQIVVDTGNLAMMDATCSIDIQSVKGVKNVLFGGEGLFNTVITGPGKVVLQTMPVNNFAAAMAPFFNTGN